MEPKAEFKRFIEKYKYHPQFILEGILIDITEQIVSLMEEKKMSRIKLAEKLKCSPAYITKLLRGDQNLTVKKLVEIALALGTELTISLNGKKEYREYPVVADKRGKKGGYIYYR
jgi:transcriptional regulator with XRE-family HTH domain